MLTEWVDADAATAFAWVTLDRATLSRCGSWKPTSSLRSPGMRGRSAAVPLMSSRSNPDRVADAALPVLMDELAEGTRDRVCHPR